MARTATIRGLVWQVWKFGRGGPSERHYKFLEVKKESEQLLSKYMGLVQRGKAAVTLTHRIVNVSFVTDAPYDVLDIDVVFLDG